MRRIMALLPVIALLLCSLNSFSQSSDEETIKKLNRGFLDAIVNRDTAALSKILADDFMLINPGGIKRNKADNLAGVLTPNQKVVSVDIDSAQVRMLSGEVGLISAWTTNVISSGGITTELKISYQDVYMKRKQGWQAVAAHVTVLNSRQVK
jgi:ketosteroid isomerase-like protein